ncbi:hypothetical protein K1719_020469 [Acacia pycnantha]|nr:hypothetical protein K1719_020469 [Acacia pycnantha]
MVGNNFGMSLRVIFTVWKVLEVEAEFLSALLNKQLTERLGGCDENEEVTEELLALCAEHVTATCALFHAFELWPQMFYAGLDMPVSDNNAAPAGINCNQLYNTTDADAAAFSLLLKQMPFHLLFPATMYWMFNRVESDVFTAKNAAFSVGCSLAAGASKERLESFPAWAISSALQSESSQKLMSNESRVYSRRSLVKWHMKIH